MDTQKKRQERFLTTLIILVSIIGIVYFGIQAIRETNRRVQDNPFEYNIEQFKKSDSSLFTYTRAGDLDVGLDELYAIAAGPKDRAYVSGDRVILQLDMKGNTHNTIRCDQPVKALSVNDSGDLYAAMGRQIQVYDSTGQKKANFTIGNDKSLITSIAAHSNGVYVADAGNRVVWQHNVSGELLNRIGPETDAEGVPEFIIPSPYFDVAIDPDGFVWIVNPGNHLLENFTPDGVFRASWGTFSMTVEGFSGCCNPTHIAILRDGSFVTSEKGIPRVKVYDRAGQLKSVVAGPDQFNEGATGLDLAVDSNNRILVLNPRQKHIRIYDTNSEHKTREAI